MAKRRCKPLEGIVARCRLSCHVILTEKKDAPGDVYALGERTVEK